MNLRKILLRSYEVEREFVKRSESHSNFVYFSGKLRSVAEILCESRIRGDMRELSGMEWLEDSERVIAEYGEKFSSDGVAHEV